jgi:predicted ATP-grasp superfamily ATP-dependent carboligase
LSKAVFTAGPTTTRRPALRGRSSRPGNLRERGGKLESKPPATKRRPRTISILFSEGSSLSARQALSALGPLGYQIDVCDPNPFCISRFSRFVRRFYRSPPLGTDPAAYLHFIVGRLRKGRYDVLLPVHEQAFLFARIQRRLTRLVGLALTAFDQFAQLQSKATFTKVLAQLDLPQPKTCLVRNRAEVKAQCAFPYYVKLPYSTAGRGVWRVGNTAERSGVITDLEAQGYLGGQTEIVIQAAASGVQCQAQAVFEHGSLIALHCTSQRSIGMGGSQSARLSIDHPVVLTHMVQLGRHLSWHGALAVDYFFESATQQPLYFEANPRLVEPMNAVLSGVNLADILVRLSLGESLKDAGIRVGKPGIRSHSLLATLLGLASASASRTRIASEVMQAVAGRGVYLRSSEDLTPILSDPLSLFPLSVVVVGLLFNPSIANHLSAHTVANYSLTPKAVQAICSLEKM